MKNTLSLINDILNIEQNKSGIDYLKIISKNIAKTLDIQYVLIVHPIDNLYKKVKTDIVWAGDDYMENFIYDLEETPCEAVFTGNRVCIHDSNVYKLFPNDKILNDLQIESYVGAPVTTRDNKVTNILILLDTKPMHDKDLYYSICEFLALRISTEIEKNRIEETLTLEVNQRTLELKKANQKIVEINNKLEEKVNKKINENKQKDIALNTQETLFKTLVENIPGVSYQCFYDKNYTMKFISKDVEVLSGYASSDFIDNKIRSFASIIHPDDVKIVSNKISTATKERKAYSIEYRIINSNNEIKWVYEKGQAIFQKEKILYLDGVILDITEMYETKKELKKLNKTLEKKVKKRTNALKRKTNKITSLLNNASQGFLSFDEDFLIDEEYSRECEFLLGKNITHEDITTLLFQNNHEKKLFFKETMIDALNIENKLTSSLLLSLLPNELIINKRAITIEYKILLNKKFMLILTNVTDKKKLQNKIKNEQNILQMIVSIVSDSSQFYELKRSFEEFCNDCLLYINVKNSVSENVNIIHALVHTFKGLFAQLYMTDTAKKLHNIEFKVFEFLDNNKSNTELKLFLESSDLISSMNGDIKSIVKHLGKEFIKEHNQIKIDEEFLTYLENKILSFSSQNIKKESQDLLCKIRKVKYKSLKEHLSIYPKLCYHLCLTLNKSIYNFEINSSNKLYISDKYKPFINSLIHVFRNCCDHGIEEREERVRLNKNEKGSITCAVKEFDQFLTIEIIDNGKGISLESIKKKVLQKKLSTEEEIQNLSENEIINFIFDSNFTTLDSISKISGRGIGLASVKIELDKLKGSVEVKTKKNEGTSFLFRLPLEKEILC